MSPPRLTRLGDVAAGVVRPGYTPSEHGVGILHIGVGAFHRAHQAVMTDAALARAGGDWRILGVSLRSRAVAEALNAQNGLYTVITRGAEGDRAQVVGAIERVIAAEPQATHQALCNPAIRIVTLTVTEKGYGIDLARLCPDETDPAVAADLAGAGPPRSVLGLLSAALAARRAAGVAPFAVVSCDNLSENGAVVRDGLVAFARHRDPDLAAWIAQEVAFPNTMVDRITPAPSAQTLADAARLTGCTDLAAVETEPFSQWVIEDRFPSGRPDWGAAGALMVSDVAPYERMKLTMLNGAHSMLAYTGFLTGHTYVRDVMANPVLAGLVADHMQAAASVLPSLPGLNPQDYGAALLARFRNPAIAHETYQIAMDGTQKLPQRIFQPAQEAVRQGQDPRPFAVAAAMWMRYCLGRDRAGAPYALRDPREAEIEAALAGAATADDISARMHALPDLIPGDLAMALDWRAQIKRTLEVVLDELSVEAVHQSLSP